MVKYWNAGVMDESHGERWHRTVPLFYFFRDSRIWSWIILFIFFAINRGSKGCVDEAILPVPCSPKWAETITYEARARLTTKLIDVNEQNTHTSPSGILPRRRACQNSSSENKKPQCLLEHFYILCYLGRISRRNADNKTHTDIFGIFLAAWRWLAGQP